MIQSDYIVDEDFALIYGVLLGDGCLCRSGKGRFISIVGHKKEDLLFFDILCDKLSKLRNKYTKYKIRDKQRKVEINFSDKELFDRFNEAGFIVGKKGTRIRFPNSINKSLWKYIIKGYFATDGSLVICNNNGIAYPRVEFQSISKYLLMDVKKYLEGVGMHGGLYISKKYEDNTNHTAYRLQFNGKANLSLFIHRIGLINPKQIIRYKKYAGEGN